MESRIWLWSRLILMVNMCGHNPLGQLDNPNEEKLFLHTKVARNEQTISTTNPLHS